MTIGAYFFFSEATSGECAQANPKNRSCTAGPFVNGPYGVHVGYLLNKPDTQISIFFIYAFRLPYGRFFFFWAALTGPC